MYMFIIRVLLLSTQVTQIAIQFKNLCIYVLEMLVA